ncbi:MAG: four helix bundle protein [Saprospiraceae bacterium]|nr:four helix bundle protein [Saprospiraceae bacterium]
MPFKFENLDVWKLSIEYSYSIYLITLKFPKAEIFNLTVQFKRAANSISLNISEGSIGQSNKEQCRFINYSIRSLAECVNCLYLAIKLEYISKLEFDELYKKSEILFSKLQNFKKAIATQTPINKYVVRS